MSLIAEFRVAIRSLRKDARTSALAICALALGIGANTAVFTVAHSVLWRPLPYRDPGRLVFLAEQSASGGLINVSHANYLDWASRSRSMERMTAAEYWTPNLTGGDRTEQILGLRATADLFDLVGVAPLLGRGFARGEDESGRERVVVLSHRLWVRRFGGDRGVLGRSIELNGQSYSIIGVMPPEFYFAPFWTSKAELWAPLAFTQEQRSSRGSRSLRVFARLKPGATLAQAQSEMDAIAASIAAAYPRTNARVGARVSDLREMTVGRIRLALLVLLGAVGFLLLIACVNTANLALARAAGRRRETAIRLALGSGRWRLVRQSLVEGVLLAAAGGLAGIALAWWGTGALLRFIPDDARFSLPRRADVQLDTVVLGFSLLATLVTGLVSGLSGAFQFRRAGLNEALKEGGRNSGGKRTTRLRAGLAAAEVAIALVLLCGAGLMIRSFQQLLSVDPGFDPRNLLAMTVSVIGSRQEAPERRIGFYRQIIEETRAIPGITAVSAANHVPFHGDTWFDGFIVEGKPAPQPGAVPSALYRFAWPRYFQTMGMRLLAGREFESSDVETAAPVAVINETMARRYWPDESALGRRFRRGGPQSSAPWTTVVGIIRDYRQWDWTSETANEMYLPLLQDAGYLRGARPFYTLTLVARTAVDPLAISPAVEARVRRLDSTVTISTVLSIEQALAESMWQWRFSMLLLGSFAALAVALAAIGIFGVFAWVVSLRKAEIGVRMALGSRPRQVVLLMLRDVARLAAVGIVLGLCGAVVLTRLMRTLLYHVSATDPIALGAAVLLLASVALAAGYVPARRAARVDPVTALRCE
jgi:putative ABC transport system permease protein